MFHFPRKYKIFRGEFQAGPFAAVFLLFLILLSFNTSLIYIPGLPLNLSGPDSPVAPDQAADLKISDRLEYRFRDKTYPGFSEFETALRQEVKTNSNLKLICIRCGHAVTNEVTARVVELARNLKLLVDLPGGRLDLPRADSLVISTNPVISLAINLSGQVYFQNQVVPEGRLRDRLSMAVRDARRPLTLLILADRKVEYDLIIKAGASARAAGIEEVLLATRPPLFKTPDSR